MSEQRLEFSNRVSRISQRHGAMSNGYSATLTGDGLIIVRPRRFQFKLPVRGFVLLMAVFMLFKGFMLASLGDASYNERLTLLNSGTVYEQAGAFVMGIDPVSQTLADAIRAITD